MIHFEVKDKDGKTITVGQKADDENSDVKINLVIPKDHTLETINQERYEQLKVSADQ